jgi:uncharacterized HhH-GPD family protein
MQQLHLAYSEAANELLRDDPLALLIGMLLDQQVPMEKAFTSPYELQERLGHNLQAQELAHRDLAELFGQRPALHRFPAAMAKRVSELARVIDERYHGDPAAIWSGVASGDELLHRLAELPGFGAQKARIFLALLGKQLGVQPPGWREAAGPYGEQGAFRSVADVVDEASLAKVRAYKKQQKAAARG